MAGEWTVEIAGGDSARIPEAAQDGKVEMLIPVRINARDVAQSTRLEIKAKCVPKNMDVTSSWRTSQQFRGQFVASVGDHWDARYESEILLRGNPPGRTEVISWREGKEPTIMIQTSDDPRDFELYLYTTFRPMDDGDLRLSQVSIMIEITYPKDLSNENKGELTEQAVVEFSEDDGTIFWREEIFGRPLLSELEALNPSGPGYSIHPKSQSTVRLVREVVPKLAKSRKRPLDLAYIGLDTSENVHAVLRAISELKQADGDVRIGTFRIVYTKKWDKKYKENFEEELGDVVEGLDGSLEWALSLEDQDADLATVDVVISTFVGPWAFRGAALTDPGGAHDLRQEKYIRELERHLDTNGVLIVVDPREPEQIARGGGSQRTQQVTRPWLIDRDMESLNKELEEGGWPTFSSKLSVIEDVCCWRNQRASIIEELTSVKVPTESLIEEYRRLAFTKGKIVPAAGRPADLEELSRPMLIPVELSRIRNLESESEKLQILQSESHLMEKFYRVPADQTGRAINIGRFKGNLASLLNNFMRDFIHNEDWGDCWESVNRPSGDHRLGFPKAEQDYRELQYDPDSLRKMGTDSLSEAGFTILTGTPAVGKTIAMRKLWIESLRDQVSSGMNDGISLFLESKELEKSIKIVDGKERRPGHASPYPSGDEGEMGLGLSHKVLMIGDKAVIGSNLAGLEEALLRELVSKSLSYLGVDSNRLNELFSHDGPPKVNIKLFVDGLDEISNKTLRDTVLSLLLRIGEGLEHATVKVIASIRNSHWDDYLSTNIPTMGGDESAVKAAQADDFSVDDFTRYRTSEGGVFLSDGPEGFDYRFHKKEDAGRADVTIDGMPLEMKIKGQYFEFHRMIRELQIVWKEESLHKELPVKLFKSWGDDMSGHIDSFREWAGGIEAQNPGWIGTPLRMSWLCRFERNGQLEDIPLDRLEFEIIRWAARDAIGRRTDFSIEDLTNEERDELVEEVLFLVAGMVALGHRWFDNEALNKESRRMTPEQRRDLISFMVGEGWGKTLLASLSNKSAGQYYWHRDEPTEFNHLDKLLFDDFTLMYIIDKDRITWTHESFKETLLAWLLTHERYDEVRSLLIRYEEQYNAVRWHIPEGGSKKYYDWIDKWSPDGEPSKKTLDLSDVNSGWYELALRLGEPPERFSEAFVPTLEHLILEMGANSFETVRRALLWDSGQMSNEYILEHPLVDQQVPYLTNGLVRMFNSITISDDGETQIVSERGPGGGLGVWRGRRKKTLCEHLREDDRFQFDWDDEQTYHEIQRNIGERGSRIEYLLGFGSNEVPWHRSMQFLGAVKKFDPELTYVDGYDARDYGGTERTHGEVWDPETEWIRVKKGWSFIPVWDERGRLLEGEPTPFFIGRPSARLLEVMRKKFDFDRRYLAHYCLPIQHTFYDAIYKESDWQPGPQRFSDVLLELGTDDWWTKHADGSGDSFSEAGGWRDEEGNPDYDFYGKVMAGEVTFAPPESKIIGELDDLFDGFDMEVSFFRWLLSQFVIADTRILRRLIDAGETGDGVHYDKLSKYIWPKYSILGRYLSGQYSERLIASWGIGNPDHPVNRQSKIGNFDNFMKAARENEGDFIKALAINFTIDFHLALQTMNRSFYDVYLGECSENDGNMPITKLLGQDEFFWSLGNEILQVFLSATPGGILEEGFKLLSENLSHLLYLRGPEDGIPECHETLLMRVRPLLRKIADGGDDWDDEPARDLCENSVNHFPFLFDDPVDWEDHLGP